MEEIEITNVKAQLASATAGNITINAKSYEIHLLERILAELIKLNEVK